jgi:hypothetical protein
MVAEDTVFKASGRILLTLSKEYSMFSYIPFTRTPEMLNKIKPVVKIRIEDNFLT